MTIAFIHNRLSFLPEVAAYQRFFAKRGIASVVCLPENVHSLKPDVAWHFMGVDRQIKQPGQLIIHEYTSGSVPPAVGLKNLYKRMFNAKPDFRLFLNHYVQSSLAFKDSIPCGIRDMGIHDEWLHASPATEKEFDFIYVGETRNRRIPELLNAFAKGSLKDHTLLLVTKDFDAIAQQYQAYPNIVFKGPVEHKDIVEWFSKARFGINFIPDEIPFNRQTSTKLLEYAACKLPIITTDYKWVRDFQQQYGGKYFFLDKDLSNFSWDNVQGFEYQFPDLAALTWEQQILGSGIAVFLEQHFPGTRITNS